jgi:hypothetical protein
MPYMVGTTEEVEKGLYLRRYGVPYEGIAHVLGRVLKPQSRMEIATFRDN